MVKIARDFELQLNKMRTSFSKQSLVACEQLDRLSRRSADCFEQQKKNLHWGLKIQTISFGASLIGGAALGFAPKAGHLIFTNFIQKHFPKLVNEFSFEGAKTGYEMTNKAYEMYKSYYADAKGFDLQAEQQQIQTETTNWNTISQAQQNLLQAYTNAIQQLQQIEEASKMR